MGHDAPDLPTAPAAVLDGHERAQLVSSVTATGHWGTVGVWLQHNPRRFWPQLSQSSKLHLTLALTSTSSITAPSSSATTSLKTASSPACSSSRRTLESPVAKSTAFLALVCQQTPMTSSAIYVGRCIKLRTNLLLLGIGQRLRIHLDGCKPSARTSSPAPPSRASWLLLGATHVGKGPRHFHLFGLADSRKQIRKGCNSDQFSHSSM